VRARARRSSIPALRRARALLALALALAALAATPTAASAAEPGCSLDPTSGTVTRTLADRSYELRVPAGLAGPDAPLLLSVHGFGGNGQVQERFTGWSGFADSHGFIVAYPNGRSVLGLGAWDPYSATSPDVGFIRRVADDIASTWCVDPDRIHVDGWSNGAVMSQRVACEAADRFASVTSYGGGTPTLGGTRPCAPSRPISVALFVGQFDFTYTGLTPNTNEWLEYDDCSPQPVRTSDPHGTLDTYSCAAGTQVLSRVVSDTSHNWPSGATGEDQRNRMWSFFEANPLP
jgi:polyhydroxybutyrate depolymerase